MGLGKTLSMLSLVLKKKGRSQDVREWMANPPAVEGGRGRKGKWRERGERERGRWMREKRGGRGGGGGEGCGKGSEIYM